MLDNLREMIEYENQTEEIQDLMLEGTDSDMMDFFIDEDGEAEIPDSELNKILNKIPEYDEDKDLNKKLNRLTEAYLPESEILEEGKISKKLKDNKLKNKAKIDDKIYDAKHSAKQGLIAGIMATTIASPQLLGLGIPSISIATIGGSAAIAGIAYASSKASHAINKRKIFKYTEGEPITRKTVNNLIDACQTKKDIKKAEKWVRLLYSKFKTINQDNPEMMKESETWRLWLKKEILDKKIPAKKEQIKQSDLKEEYVPDYINMDEEEFYEAMEYENGLFEEYEDINDYDEYMEEGISNRAKKMLSYLTIGSIASFASFASLSKTLCNAVASFASETGDAALMSIISQGEAQKALMIPFGMGGAICLAPVSLVAGFLSGTFDRQKLQKEMKLGYINEQQIKSAIKNIDTVKGIKQFRNYLKDVIKAYDKLKTKNNYDTIQKNSKLVYFIKTDAQQLLSEREQEIKNNKKAIKEFSEIPEVEFFD